MKKIMLVIGMKGIENLEDYIKKCRKAVEMHYAIREDDVHIIDTFFSKSEGNRLEFLGKSFLEGIALADEIVFIDDWEKHDDCRCERLVAAQYGVTCQYLSTKVLESECHDNAYAKQCEASSESKHSDCIDADQLTFEDLLNPSEEMLSTLGLTPEKFKSLKCDIQSMVDEISQG